jgi:hypothetical protein
MANTPPKYKRDADACIDDGDRHMWGRYVDLDSDIGAKAAFESAYKRAMEAGGVDLMLEIGSLDNSGAVQCLIDVIGASPDVDYVYSNDVPGLFANAQ